jgi:hypothetical protein
MSADGRREVLAGDFKVEAFAGAAVFESLPHGDVSPLMHEGPPRGSRRPNRVSYVSSSMEDPYNCTKLAHDFRIRSSIYLAWSWFALLGVGFYGGSDVRN